MTPIAPHITAWLRERLPVERVASPHTCDAYAITFQLFFKFVAMRCGVAPAGITFELLDAPMVLQFLEHLGQERGNGASTRNARLAAIKSFMRFMQFRDPAGLEQVRAVLAIPAQRTTVGLVEHLDREETQALLDAPDPTTRSGVRDRTLLFVAVTGGLRVSEVAGLRVADLSFRDRYVDVQIRGKGRRERVLTLWREVADAIRQWLVLRGNPGTPELFVNARDGALTRSGIEYILRKHVKLAGSSCPSLRSKKVSPHTLRHTCAVNTLRATRDIRKVAMWLGHSSTRTTEIYLRSDPTDRIETLEAVVPPSLRRGSFSPPDKLIASLRPQ